MVGVKGLGGGPDPLPPLDPYTLTLGLGDGVKGEEFMVRVRGKGLGV